MALAATPAVAATKKKPFTPKKVAGSWSGTWTNHTFNTTGPITLQTKLVRKGKGDNHWNSKGFRLHLNSPAYGIFAVKYVDKTHKLTGSGGNPSCAPGVTWTLDGKLTHAAFTGTVSIKLAHGQTASSSLTANRQ